VSTNAPNPRLPGNIVLLKLRSGEEIIARQPEVSSDGELLHLTHVRVLHLIQDRNHRGPSVSLFPFLLGCTHPDVEIPVLRKDVMVDLTPHLNPGLERSYFESTSGLALVSN